MLRDFKMREESIKEVGLLHVFIERSIIFQSGPNNKDSENTARTAAICHSDGLLLSDASCLTNAGFLLPAPIKFHCERPVQTFLVAF